MRIAYVHSRAFPSVDANVVQVVQMCRSFARLGHDVTLFIPRHADCATDDAALTRARELLGSELGFRVVFVPRRKILGRFEVLGSVRGTLEALRQHPQNLIYSRNPWSVAFLGKTGVPFVWEAHEEHVHKRSRVLSWYLERMIVRASRRPELIKVVAISGALAKVWEGYGIPSGKLLTAHDGVDLALFGDPLPKPTARKQLGLAVDRRVIMYTGTLRADRGVALMLESARRIPEADFILIGGTPDEVAHWQSEAARAGHGNVRFTGKIPHRDVPLWLSAADILLPMRTWQESNVRVCSPMKLFEYMAAKRLIVGPAFPTVLEVIADGEHALLFKPDDIAAMESALRAGLVLVDDPALPRRAYETVAQRYTWESRCRLILDSLDLQKTRI
ncbi:MAG: glycosyltransferase family 4 protein [bacterium]|nr:glycosyltransferase family 4 protein [bacterium]